MNTSSIFQLYNESKNNKKENTNTVKSLIERQKESHESAKKHALKFYENFGLKELYTDSFMKCQFPPVYDYENYSVDLYDFPILPNGSIILDTNPHSLPI